MQVPAYWPLVEGVHWAEKSGVLVDAKRVVPIIVEFEVDEDMSMTQPARLAKAEIAVTEGKMQS